jgi:glutamate 5-kinase
VRRVVLKIGSSSLTSDAGAIEAQKLAAIAASLGSDVEFAIVSSGAVAAGAGLLARGRPRTLPEKQAFAAVGQAELMRCWAQAFAPHGKKVAQFLLSSDDIRSRKRFINAKQALEAAFKLGVLPILNENDTVATAELRVGDNDTLSAWVAYLIGADTLLLLTDVDGLYTGNPKTDPSAVKLEVVPDVDAVLHLGGAAGSARGTGGMRTKLKAAQIAAQAGIDTVILSGGGAGVARWLRGEAIGTRILATGNTAKRGWIAHQPTKGVLSVDAGAKAAMLAGKSLLPSGILAVSGSFERDDPVAIECQQQLLGQGLSNYRADELRRIAGKRSSEISAILGAKPFDEAIHRDRLVLKAADALSAKTWVD